MKAGRRFAPGLCAAGFVLALGGAHAGEPPAAGAATLAATHRALKPQLENNVFGVPLYVESEDKDGRTRGDVYGVLRYPYATVRGALRAPENWCDLVTLHLNIKACTYAVQAGAQFMTFYSGRKFYEPPDRAYPIRYVTRGAEPGADYFRMTFSAADGPLGTRNYLILVEAVPLAADAVFLHFGYAYEYGTLMSLARSGYLATLGSGKVGFSIVGKDEAGKPVYAGGVPAVVERNVVRYYLAIQAYLETLGAPEAERFERRLGRWFDLTERYREQLHEMEKEEYLRFKRQERAEQLQLQRQIDQGVPERKPPSGPADQNVPG